MFNKLKDTLAGDNANKTHLAYTHISLSPENTVSNTSSKRAEEKKLQEQAVNTELLPYYSLDDLIAHNLAHAIRDQEPDKFLAVYDKIPADFNQLRVSPILVFSFFKGFNAKNILSFDLNVKNSD